MKISSFLIVHNEKRNLPLAIGSVLSFSDEIVVVDSGSNDGTQKLAAEAGARVIEHGWEGYAGQKNFAMSQCLNDWVFSIDADEVCDEDLQESILRLKGGAASLTPAGYLVSRVANYRGRWIRCGNWFPDPLPRLFDRRKSKFAGGRVHERVEIDGELGVLPGELLHYSFGDKKSRARTVERYARLWAEDAAENGKSCSAVSPFLHGLGRWARGYLWRRGWMDGSLGWEIAMDNAYEAYAKYRALREITAGVSDP